MTKFKNGAEMVAVRFGDKEVRRQEDYSQPFPLYPFEEMEKKPTEYVKVNKNNALVLKAVRPFFDEVLQLEREIDDEYLFIGGMGVYIPRIEEEIVEEIKFPTINPQTALVVSAKKDLVDAEGNNRVAGQKWLVRT
mmetsp:Transcript_18971/g.13759  ORF Transcript_18971/g.13759 Transcript_18971/m.13759 type:complete len:136 (-) Transcript_18971:1977-2384(-)